MSETEDTPDSGSTICLDHQTRNHRRYSRSHSGRPAIQGQLALHQRTVFREELTWTESLLDSRTTFAAEDKGALIAYYALNPMRETTVDLEHLFVDPGQFGRGIGRRLFDHACATAAASDFRTMTIMSDPNAAGFYHKLGCRKVKDIPSSIPGRQIPLFHFDLTARAPNP